MEKCSDCGYVFDESAVSQEENRIPCPRCGSLNREVEVNLSVARIHAFTAGAEIRLNETLDSSPTLLIPTIVTFETEVPEGQVISVLQPFYDELVRKILSDPEIIYQISPRKWEEIVAAAYDKEGFDEVILTPHSGDNGRDVIATKRGILSIRIIDQVKKYGLNYLVTADDVRSLYGALSLDQNTSKAVITTTSHFAPRIKDNPYFLQIIPYRLELVDREILLQRLKNLRR